MMLEFERELATQFQISPKAVGEAVRRGLLTFKRHRNVRCWRFGDATNGCLRRVDGQSFKICGERVKAEAETRGDAWHRLIGLQDVVANDRRDVLLMPEGSKDALAALHFADAEGTLLDIGVVVALGSGIKPSHEDLEKFRGRRVRIIADADTAGEDAAARVGQELASFADEVQAFNLAGLSRDDDVPVKDLFDATRIDYDSFETNRHLWSVTDLNCKKACENHYREARSFPFAPPSPSCVSWVS